MIRSLVALVVLVPPPSVEVTPETLGHSKPEVRKQAAIEAKVMLKQIKDRPPEWIPALSRLVTDGDEATSLAAGYALGLYELKGLPALVAPFADRDKPVPVGAAEGLMVAAWAGTRHRSMLPALFVGLEGHQPEAVRLKCACALRYFEPTLHELKPKGLEVLRERLADRTRGMLPTIQAIYQHLGPDGYAPLLAIVADDTPSRQYRALVVVRDIAVRYRVPKDAVEVIRKAARSDDEDVRGVAEVILEQVKLRGPGE